VGLGPKLILSSPNLFQHLCIIALSKFSYTRTLQNMPHGDLSDSAAAFSAITGIVSIFYPQAWFMGVGPLRPFFDADVSPVGLALVQIIGGLLMLMAPIFFVVRWNTLNGKAAMLGCFTASTTFTVVGLKVRRSERRSERSEPHSDEIYDNLTTYSSLPSSPRLDGFLGVRASRLVHLRCCFCCQWPSLWVQCQSYAYQCYAIGEGEEKGTKAGLNRRCPVRKGGTVSKLHHELTREMEIYLQRLVWNFTIRSAHRVFTVEGVLLLIFCLDSEASSNDVKGVFLSILVSPSLIALEQERKNVEIKYFHANKMHKYHRNSKSEKTDIENCKVKGAPGKENPKRVPFKFRTQNQQN